MGICWSGDHRELEGAELATLVDCWRLERICRGASLIEDITCK